MFSIKNQFNSKHFNEAEQKLILQNVLEERLFIASAAGNVELVQELLSDGANVNAQNEQKQSALYITAEAAIFDKKENSKKIVELLLESKATPENKFVECLVKNALTLTPSELDTNLTDNNARTIIPTLKAAIEFSLNTCILGPSNKIDKIEYSSLMRSRLHAGLSLNNRYVKKTLDSTNEEKTSTPCQWSYLKGAARENDLFLISADEPSEINMDILKKAEKEEIPILMRIGDKFYIFGNSKNDGVWKLTLVDSRSFSVEILLKELPFKDGILKSYDARFTIPLIDILSRGHTYSSQYFVVAIEKSPLNDLKYNLTSEQYLLLLHCIKQHQGERMGNCYLMSELVTQYIWSICSAPSSKSPFPKITRIELVKTKTFDHYMVIINRQGELKNSETWGDAWVIDPWYGTNGKIYHASEFKRNIEIVKEYARLQSEKLSQAGVNTGDFSNEDETLDAVVCEIEPEKHLYPHELESSGHRESFGQEHYVIENLLPYYLTEKEYETGDRLKQYKAEFQLHRNKFKFCTSEITLFEKNKSLKRKNQNESEIDLSDQKYFCHAL